MTDPDVADKTYIEPITTEIIEEIIKKDADWLNEKFQQYKVKNNSVKELLVKMDIIPPSLAIALMIG